jgi:hypothetical protein
MMATKAEITKLQEDLKKAENDLAKAKAATAPKPENAANDYLRLGPLGGLASGAVAGVTGNIVDQNNSTISNVDDDGTFGGSDKRT